MWWPDPVVPSVCQRLKMGTFCCIVSDMWRDVDDGCVTSAILHFGVWTGIPSLPPWWLPRSVLIPLLIANTRWGSVVASLHGRCASHKFTSLYIYIYIYIYILRQYCFNAQRPTSSWRSQIIYDYFTGVITAVNHGIYIYIYTCWIYNTVWLHGTSVWCGLVVCRVTVFRTNSLNSADVPLSNKQTAM